MNDNVKIARLRLHATAAQLLMENSDVARGAAMQIMQDRGAKVVRNKHRPTKAEKKAHKKARQK